LFTISALLLKLREPYYNVTVCSRVCLHKVSLKLPTIHLNPLIIRRYW